MQRRVGDRWLDAQSVKRTSVHPIAVLASLAREVRVLRQELANVRELLVDSDPLFYGEDYGYGGTYL